MASVLAFVYPDVASVLAEREREQERERARESEREKKGRDGRHL